MKESPAHLHPGDITDRDLLSSLTALQFLSMVMTDSRGEDEILDLAVSALPSLSHHCRAEAVWLDGEWRSVDSRRGPVGPLAGVEAQLAGLGGADGLVQLPDRGWAWAFRLAAKGGGSGYLVVGSPRPPPEYERSLIQALAQQTGAALANARLFAGEQAARARISDEQATLRRVATLVAQGGPPEEVFSAVAAEAGRLLGADFAVMSRYHPEGTATVVGTWARSGMTNPLPAGTTMAYPDRSVHTLVFDTRQPSRIDDYGDTPGPGPSIARSSGVHSVVGVPIILEGQLWGQIGVASGRRRPLPAETETWLAGFTELVATATAHAQARVELRGIAEEQAALRRIATLVARGATPEEVFTAVVDEVGQLPWVDLASICRYESDSTITFVASWGRACEVFPVGGRLKLAEDNLGAIVLRTGRSARIDHYADTASGPIGVGARQAGINSSLAAPIMVEGRLWGVIAASSILERPLPADTETRLAEFTELLGTAVANAESRSELAQLAEEQAALRRVATLVARGMPPKEVFDAVTEEVGRLLCVEFANLARYEPDGTTTFVANWGETARRFRPATRLSLGGHNLATVIFETGRPARIDNYADASGQLGVTLRRLGVRSAVAAPITVESRLWGIMAVGSTREQRLPPDTEARLAHFTDLVATAIANAESRAELTASRAAGIVAAADDSRRRIERDLHDGAQQQLVTLGLKLRAVASEIPAELEDLHADVGGVARQLEDVLDELRELSHGIHPAVLTRGGLGPALKTLARRAPIPVEIDLQLPARLPEPTEVAIYYVVAEALTNVAKHGQASVVVVEVEALDGGIRLSVCDDGAGGADPSRGSGLLGLRDRIDALGGRMNVASPPGAGTSIMVQFPVTSE